MSAVHHYKLQCDAAGCDAEINLGLARADHTRARAVDHGWVVNRVETRPEGGPARASDYCPRHA